MTGIVNRPHRAWAALAACAMVGLMVLSCPATAQQEADKERPEDVQDSDCAKLPGGNAPVNMMARLQGGIAVENLEFTYFGKKLFQLTQRDFDYLRKLIPYCQDKPQEQTNYIIDRLSELVFDAQDVRNKSIAWIKDMESQLKKMPATRESIEEVHNIWTELQNRQLEMTKADASYLSKILDETRDRLYRDAQLDGGAPRRTKDPQVEVSPFLPETPTDDRQPDPS